MNDSPREQHEQWSSHWVQVGPPLGYASFIGKILINDEEVRGESHIFHYTLFQTPRSGYMLYVEEDVMKGSGEILPGQPYSELKEIRKTLYSEEEAKRKHPDIFEKLLRRVQRTF